MNTKITDVLVHTRETLNERQLQALSDQVYSDPGVVSVTRNIHRPRLLMVVYDAARTQSMQILAQVRGMGYQASLVAM